MRTRKNYIILCKIFIITFAFNSLSAYAPTNFHRPHDVDFRAYDWRRKDNKTGKKKFHHLRVGTFCEYGKTDESRNWDDNKLNALQLYNCYESSVAMLLGAPLCSITAPEINALAKSLGVSAATVTEDNYRGRFCVTGEFEKCSLTFFTRYRLPISLEGTFELSLFVPFKHMEFNDVLWQDLTRDYLTEDKEFKEDISSKLAQRAMDLGGLYINCNGYIKNGLGDAILMLGWYKDFKQTKEYLKNVRINAQVGVSIPTGSKRDINQSFAMPLGNDGAWGIPASLGLDLDFIYKLRAGVDLSFFALFDTSGIYRMKTSRHQTDFLLLNRGRATKSQGATWKFTLYGQAKKIFFRGLSAMVSYHFLRHDEDRLSPKNYNFDYSIVNTAQSLKEWSTHSFVFQVGYNPFGINSKRRIKPNISLFYKLPVTGKRALLTSTIGGQIGFNW